MKLKECTSFVSDKKSTQDGEKDRSGARDASPMRSNPSHTEPNSQWCKSTGEPQMCRETPHSQRRVPHEAQQRRYHPNQIRVDQTGSDQISTCQLSTRSDVQSRSDTQTGSDQISTY